MHDTVLWVLGNGTLHAKTLIMTWVTMILLLGFVFLCKRNLTSGTPGKLQNLLEWIIDFVRGLISDNMNYKKGSSLLGYLLSLIMFVFFANMIGLIPNIFAPLLDHVHFARINEMFGGAIFSARTTTFSSPTADVNTTFALSTITIVLVLVYGLKYKGAHYFKHFLEPYPPFAILHIIDFVAKPLTLAFRLFGNIYAGEILIAVILMIPGIFAFAGVIPMPFWLVFCVFIAVIQSYVFTILTVAYVGQAIEESH